MNLVWVMCGGGVGAGLRFLLSTTLPANSPSTFPYATLTANLAGCLCIGLLTSLFSTVWEAPEPIRLGLLVGVLGGFTTFSSFGLESIALLQEGRLGAAALYVAVSNIGGLLSVWLGLKLFS